MSPLLSTELSYEDLLKFYRNQISALLTRLSKINANNCKDYVQKQYKNNETNGDICFDESQNLLEKCSLDLISQIDRFKRVERQRFERYLAVVNESLSGGGLFLSKHRQAEMENDLVTFQKELDYLIIDLQMTSNADTKQVQFENYFYSLNGLDFKHMRQIEQSNNVDDSTIMGEYGTHSVMYMPSSSAGIFLSRFSRITFIDFTLFSSLEFAVHPK
ncbi:unnamed protein product [Didymodactylos carnosus]|uniref:Uncharacterized protein n=1 Tax=Didymodactylos carnosus TaxID=1234261 RepID=A0A815CKV1_9BILA|nr:unnamed protein product [Didymodactylos carnosus]CAF1285084.1 unnamed protein product [Didymodactylos carnosus]CAF3801882.1 unnamed protein product [Didymodactylos carnosus]CAF4084477.1 unnamed protein product [Didymodactylos carnosus]